MYKALIFIRNVFYVLYYRIIKKYDEAVFDLILN